MTVTEYYECPKCYAEIAVEVEIGEDILIDEECPECSYKMNQEEIGKIYSEVSESAIGSAIDSARDYFD